MGPGVLSLPFDGVPLTEEERFRMSHNLADQSLLALTIRFSSMAENCMEFT